MHNITGSVLVTEPALANQNTNCNTLKVNSPIATVSVRSAFRGCPSSVSLVRLNAQELLVLQLPGTVRSRPSET